MPRKMEERINGKPHASSRIPAPKSRKFHPNNLENGFEREGNNTGKVLSTTESNAQARTEQRRYETYVMTGDHIIQTTSPLHKPDSLQSSPTGSPKKTAGVKESPVPNKKLKGSESPRASPKREIPKKVVHSPKGPPRKIASPAKEAESQVTSPKKESPVTKKSPNKHSRLPRPGTPVKNSPKQSPKIAPKHAGTTGTPPPSRLRSPSSRENLHKMEPTVSHGATDSVKLPEVLSEDLTLLGYTRYPDIPVELDIPPDDISSEDEKYKHEGVVDINDLPPPPDEFFNPQAEVPSNQEPLPEGASFVVMDTSPPAPYTEQLAVTMHPNSAEGEVPVSPVDIAEVLGDDRLTHVCNMELDTTQTSFQSVEATTREQETIVELLGPPPGHGRSASCGESSAISTNSAEPLPGRHHTPVRTMVVSKSAEKIAPGKSSSSMTNKKCSPASVGVRSSKSQENYLECNDSLKLVDIDLDDQMASSVDALHYEQTSTNSLDSLGYVQFSNQARSLDNSPDKRTADRGATGDRVFMPGFISLEEPRSISKLKEGTKLRDFSKAESQEAARQPGESKSKSSGAGSPSHSKSSAIPILVQGLAGRKPPRPPARSTSNQAQPTSPTSPSRKTETTFGAEPQEQAAPASPSKLKVDVTTNANSATREPSPTIIESPKKTFYQVDMELPSESDTPIATSSSPPSPVNLGPGSPDRDLNVYHQPLKDIDRPSAARLAKRLFNLEGFKKGDVTRHLCKKNDFAFLVGEEYLKFFDFTGETLDQALRNFLKNLTLAGETQERERVLAHFSHRYMQTNPGSFNSEDACHTLVCALMLLNTDLHGQNIGRKMTVNEFVDNLADLNDGENFPREVLKNLHHSIRTDPLECHFEELEDSDMSSISQRGQVLGHNPFLDMPDPSKATEYKKGYVMRKCCMDPDGRKTPMGKRGWKMFYSTLRDMVLYLSKDDHAFKRNTMVPNTTNAIRIHHALACRATDYKKKQFVFRLQTADCAQYLFQTSNSKECQEWIDTINFVASSLSAPPLPGGVGSQKKFQRPLLTASHTRLNLREQLLHHEQKLLTLEQDLHEHRKYPPEKGAKSRFIQDYMEKESYLVFELKRFKVYSALLQMKLASFPELEPSLVEIAIGEVDEPTSSPSSPEQAPRVIGSETSADQTDVLPPAVMPAYRSNQPVQRSISDRSPRPSTDSEDIAALPPDSDSGPPPQGASPSDPSQHSPQHSPLAKQSSYDRAMGATFAEPSGRTRFEPSHTKEPVVQGSDSPQRSTFVSKPRSGSTKSETRSRSGSSRSESYSSHDLPPQGQYSSNPSPRQPPMSRSPPRTKNSPPYVYSPSRSPPKSGTQQSPRTPTGFRHRQSSPTLVTAAYETQV